MKTIHSCAVAGVAFLLQAALQVVALAQTPVQPPTAITGPVRDVGATLATLSATVNVNGSPTSIKFQWGLTTDYGSETVINITQPFTTPFTELGKISGLTQNTTYHYRVSATNAGGTTNGDDASFTTPVAKPPSIPSNVMILPTGPTSVTITGTVVPNGSPTTARFQYALYKSDVYVDVPVVPDPGFGLNPVPVKATITGLTPGTGYRFRLSATNQAGPVTSDGMVYTTAALRAPIVVTYPATTPGASTATLNGLVSFDIGEGGTAKFQYGATADYGSEAVASVLTDGSNRAAAALTSLAPGTTYHYRISATNDTGTSNGDDLTFTTLATDAPQPPYVGATIPAGTISSAIKISGVFRCFICPNGLPTTAKFQIGTTTSYGSDTPITLSPANGTILQKCSAQNIPLQPSTTYHCRFTATNDAGTTNSEDYTFTSDPLISAPIVGDAVPTVTSSKTATINSTINPGGGSTTASVEYGLTTSYGSSHSITGPFFDYTTHPVSATLTALKPNTTYHCRVTASNDLGTTHGADATFTTPVGDPTTPASPGPWLTYEMRIDSATSSPGVTVTDVHHAVAGAAGDVVGVQIYAVVNSANSNHADDGFMLGEGSFVSTGALLGDLRGDIAGQPTTQVNNVAPFDLASIAQSGYQADLDSDGDLDIGSNLTASNAVLVFPWFVAWSDLNQGSIPILGSGSGTGPTEFLIGRTTFTVGVGAQPGQETTVKFQPRIRNDGAAPVKLTQQFTLDGLAVKLAGDDPNIALVDASIRLADAPVAPVAPPPTVVTGPAKDFGSTLATLTATVNANGSPTTAKFQIGMSAAAYDTEVPVTPSPGDGTAALSVSAQLLTLSPQTTYHYRIVATNSGGSTVGEDKTFTTIQPILPLLIFDGVELGTTSVTFNARVVQFGSPVTSVVFQSGETDSYGTDTPARKNSDGLIGAVPVAATLTGLTPGKTYHYRLVATNLAGTTTSEDHMFTTYPLTLPPVTTYPATTIGANAATLNATVVSYSDQPITVKFQYGLTTDYGSVKSLTPLPDTPPGSMSRSPA